MSIKDKNVALTQLFILCRDIIMDGANTAYCIGCYIYYTLYMAYDNFETVLPKVQIEMLALY